MRTNCKTCPFYPMLTRAQRKAREERRGRRWFRLLWIDVADLVRRGRRVALH